MVVAEGELYRQIKESDRKNAEMGHKMWEIVVKERELAAQEKREAKIQRRIERKAAAAATTTAAATVRFDNLASEEATVIDVEAPDAIGMLYRITKAFSYHTCAGMVGSAIAPVTLLAMQGFVGWRGAFLGASLFGVIAALILMLQPDPVAERRAQPLKPRGTTSAENQTDGQIWAAARSAHSGGVVTALGDSAVTFVTDDIDLVVWQSLSTRSGNESVRLP